MVESPPRQNKSYAALQGQLTSWDLDLNIYKHYLSVIINVLPQDRRSIHRCLRHVGQNHPIHVQALVAQLLAVHPYFDGVEPSVQDGEYICKVKITDFFFLSLATL